MAVIDELLVGLGFEYDNDEVKEFSSDLEKTIGQIKKLAIAAIGAATALTGLTIATTAASDEQGKLANEIGINVSELDALQFALERSGGTAQGMSNSLQQLSVRISEAARGMGSGVEAFSLLGIQVQDTNGDLKATEDIFQEVSGALQGLDRARQIELAEKLGLRDSIRLLQQGPDEIRALTEEARLLGVTTEEDAAISADFQDALTGLFRVFRQLARVLTRELAPILEGIVETFNDWFKANRELIEQNLPVWFDRAARALRLLSLAVAFFLALKLASALIGIAGALTKVRNLVLGLGALFAAPKAVILGIVSALGLLAEDSNAFFSGQKSVIGDLIEIYPEWENEIVAVAKVLKGLFDLGAMVIDGWRQLIALFNDVTLDEFLDTLKTIPGFIADLGSQLLALINDNIVQPIADSISATFTNIKNSITESINSLVSTVSSTIQNILSPIKDTIDSLFNIDDLIANIRNSLVSFFGVIIAEITNFFTNSLSSIIDIDGLLDDFGGQITAFFEDLKNKFTGFFDNLVPSFLRGGPRLTTADPEDSAATIQRAAREFSPSGPIGQAAAAALQTTNNNNNRTNVVQLGGVTINADSAQAADIVAELENLLQQSFQEVDSNVDQ